MPVDGTHPLAEPNRQAGGKSREAMNRRLATYRYGE